MTGGWLGCVVLLSGVLLAACASAPRTDIELTFAVKTAFVNDAELLRNPSVLIETSQGVVHLAGTVPEQAQKDRLEQLARAVPGVKSVRNDVVVKYVFQERP